MMLLLDSADFSLLHPLLSQHFLIPTSHNGPCCNTDADMTGGRLKLKGNRSNVIEEHQETRSKK